MSNIELDLDEVVAGVLSGVRAYYEGRETALREYIAQLEAEIAELKK
jgi:hypothetical protein